MAAFIGIKIANGEFYSILNENSSTKKRLILTTVHDNQRSVQIDLYKSDTKTMADALYIGSLVVENIKPKEKGIPSIELTISVDGNGIVTAVAIDIDSANNSGQQYLNVSLKSLNDDERDYDPDFEIGNADPPPVGLYEKPQTTQKTRNITAPLLIAACMILILLMAGFGLWYFNILGGFLPNLARSRPAAPQPTVQPQPVQTPSVQQPAPAQPAEPTPQQTVPAQQQPTPLPEPTPEQTAPAQPVQQPAPIIPPPVQQAVPVQTPPPAAQTPAPVIRAPTQAPAQTAAPQRARPVAPVRSYRVPTTIPREGVAYRVRYGDTLWDIAEVFYRNPWLYPRIARFNNIRNPDRIISGTTIRIPPRN